MSLLKKLKESTKLGLEYLENNCRPVTGFQTDVIGSSRTNLEPKYFPEAIFLNLLTLDKIGDNLSVKTRNILRRSLCPDEPSLAQLYSSDGSSGRPYFTGTINFNKYNQIIPDDTEDTGYYHYIALRDGFLEKGDRRLQDIARLIYLNVAENGVIRLYYPPMDKRRENTIDQGSLANALRFLYFYDVDTVLFQKSEDHLYDWLTSGNYLGGTRYYPSPEVFLYFCAEAVSKNERALMRFREPLIRELKVRVDYILRFQGHPKFPIDISACVLGLGCLKELGSPEVHESAYEMCGIIMAMQNREYGRRGQGCGGWPADVLYKLGRTDTFLGGSDASTIFAVAAIITFEQSIGEKQASMEGVRAGVAPKHAHMIL